MRPDQYEMVNGYSNMFWGWGREDSDMEYRMSRKGLQPVKPANPESGNYYFNKKNLENFRGPFYADVNLHNLHNLVTHIYVRTKNSKLKLKICGELVGCKIFSRE